MRNIYKLFKRVFDIFFSSLALILLAPVFIILSILVLIDLGRPIYFVQTRPGYKGKLFKIIKFRTMTFGKQNAEDDEVRLTRLGKILRRTSLDEIPEFINILKGEMSVVGPRPLLVEYLDKYSPSHARRHDVRPGLTGLAQISGRNDISWDDKLDIDIEYVDKASFRLDLQIILKTTAVVLSSKGVSKSGCETTTTFKGSK